MQAVHDWCNFAMGVVAEADEQWAARQREKERLFALQLRQARHKRTAASGAPEGADPMGQELPLFACMGLKREVEAGRKVPLFMSAADCASAAAEESDAALEVDAVFSLQSVVEELAALDFPSSEGEFAFEPPSASLQHLASYVGQGVYMRKVDADEE